MRERVEQLVGERGRGMWISTFHSACVRILRREAEQFGFTKAFTIYDSGDSRALIKRLVKEHEADALGLTPAGVQGRISKLKNELADAESFARQANMSDPAERLFVEIFGDYQGKVGAAVAALKPLHGYCRALQGIAFCIDCDGEDGRAKRMVAGTWKCARSGRPGTWQCWCRTASCS